MMLYPEPDSPTPMPHLPATSAPVAAFAVAGAARALDSILSLVVLLGLVVILGHGAGAS